MDNHKTLLAEFAAIKAKVISTISELFPSPEYPDSEYVMLVLVPPVVRSYGTINTIIKNVDGAITLMDEDDAEMNINYFPDLETLIFIISTIEAKQYQQVE